MFGNRAANNSVSGSSGRRQATALVAWRRTGRLIPAAATRTLLRAASAGVGLWLATTGCATVSPPAARTYVILVRYDAEPRFVNSDRVTAVEAIGRDFRDIAALGFDGVVLSHVDNSECLPLLDLAHENGLTAQIPDRRFEHFVLTGALPQGCSGVRELGRTIPIQITDHPALGAIAVSSGRSPRGVKRAEALTGCLTDRDLPRSLVTETGVTVDGLRLATVRTRRSEAGPLESLMGGLQRQFHAGLRVGSTAGLMLDRYGGLPGDGHVLTPPAEGFTSEQAAAIEALLARARKWGRRLAGLAAEPILGVVPSGPDVQLTALMRGARRYVLVSNPSMDQYARGEVVLPGSIGGMPANRAVEVPPTSGPVAGRVTDAQGGQIALSVTLRPGDAALFEIF